MSVNLKPKTLPKGYTITASAELGGGLMFEIMDATGETCGYTGVDVSGVKNESTLEQAVIEAVGIARAHAKKETGISEEVARTVRAQKAAQKIADKLNRG